MPPMAAAVGSSNDVKNLANYVLSLSNSPHDSLRGQLGRSKFTACAACHGIDGKGNAALGAPNLTDDIWLHGWGEQAIIAMINGGKVSNMPGQAGKLTEAQIQLLGAYVWGLSNKPSHAPALTEAGVQSSAESQGHPHRSRAGTQGDRLAVRSAEENLSALGVGHLLPLALDLRRTDPARFLRAALAGSGASARPCCSTWGRAASTYSGWRCIPRTSSTSRPCW